MNNTTTAGGHDAQRLRLSFFSMENAPDLLIWTNSCGDIIWVNKTVCTLTGYLRDELLGMKAYDLNGEFSKEDWLSVWARVKDAGFLSIETVLNQKDGSTLPVDAIHNHIEFEGREYLVSFVRDITGRKNTERQLRDALEAIRRLKEQVEEENLYLKDEIRLTHDFTDIIAVSLVMKEMLQHIEIVANTDATVLLLGETGTGKELIARALHNASRRKARAFVKIDCTNLSQGLFESELFGHERGAFTGAVTARHGRLKIADKGTLFIDEVGELPLEQQGKLLRLLQDGEYERVGSDATSKVDVRIIAATNRDLKTEVKEKRFREDLYFRLNVFPVPLPPLREREGDIPLLTRHFVTKYAKKMGKTIERIPVRTINLLSGYSWPGNIRELENIIERAVILSRSDSLEGVIIPASSENDLKYNTDQTLDTMQRNYIIQTLKRTGWRVSGEKGAAKILGINPHTLTFRMKKLGINRPV